MDILTDLLRFFIFYTGVFFLLIVFRYFLAAGIFYYYYYIKNKQRHLSKKLSKRKPKNRQIKNEIKWSIISSAIFAVAGTLIYYMYEQGLTGIYISVGLSDIFYIPFSLLLILLIHETYYYWIHRWMHLPAIYKYVHKVHHDSLTPTPWTAFSFHPWEALIMAIIIPAVLIFLPVHLYVIMFYLILMTISSVVNHLDIEIYPRKFRNSIIGQQFIGATHHHFHHSEFNTNYGLYFTFWDRWLKTESKQMPQ
ncbi:sterol desaturase family protein [Christiangramia aquimixticola]|uniref:sterol desaturase family protein n=1 Tax=Christiangramia aquimixticola TaxID=1697558 RepID=UPI003AA8C889